MNKLHGNTGRKRPDLSARNKTHGMGKTPTYRSWCSMRSRCNNPNFPSYSYYGARGITVCPEWETFEQFLADMGQRPEGTSIERIDNDGNYCKSNCRWATKLEQARNTRRLRNVTLDGQTKCLSEWCEAKGLNYDTVLFRIDELGWSYEKALTTPAGPRNGIRFYLQEKSGDLDSQQISTQPTLAV